MQNKEWRRGFEQKGVAEERRKRGYANRVGRRWECNKCEKVGKRGMVWG